MYQIEVKAALMAHCFPPARGWRVIVDIDAMERATGGQHPVGRQERAAAAEQQMVGLGVTGGRHPEYGRADVVAEHPHSGTVVVEVEGESSKQREQAIYSALGQTAFSMWDLSGHTRSAIAVPDTEDWRRQLRKVPRTVTERLHLQLLAVSTNRR